MRFSLQDQTDQNEQTPPSKHVWFRRSGGIHSRGSIASAILLSLCLLSTAHYVGAAEKTSESDSGAKSGYPYQRLDFQVKASCVNCLRKVARALKETRGVLNADVSIYYPHWAVVIIDKSMVDDKKIIARVAKEKAGVDKLLKQDLKDKPIIVVPRSDIPAKL